MYLAFVLLFIDVFVCFSWVSHQYVLASGGREAKVIDIIQFE